MNYFPATNYEAMHASFLQVSYGMTADEAKAEAQAEFGRMHELRVLAARRFCNQHGHRLVDESYGGPESGCIDMHCSRCGWSCHHTLY